MGVGEGAEVIEMKEWTEGQYGFYYLDLGIVRITVGWRDSKHYYGYSYAQVRSKKSYEDIEKCKKDAVESVKRRLQAALEMLK